MKRAALLFGLSFGLLFAGPALSDPISSTTLRVCADPDDPPFSLRDGTGIENRVARALARALGREVEYVWRPSGIGFLEQTLLRGRCDVVVGDVRPHRSVSETAPWMSAGYALVARPGTIAEGVSDLDDPRLAGIRIGVVTGSPPATRLARDGRIGDARPYRPALDRRHWAPVGAMVDDLAAGRVDALVLWYPTAAHAARAREFEVVALSTEGDPPLRHDSVLSVRAEDKEWRAELDRALAAARSEISTITAPFTP